MCAPCCVLCRGGRCRDPSLCLEAQTPNTPEEIYISNVGVTPDGAPVDIRITAETEYRAWREDRNGIKRQEVGDTVGFFGVVNLLGERVQQTARHLLHLVSD